VELLAISEGGLSLRTDDPDAAWELSNIDRMFADWTMFGEIGVGWNRAWIPFANDGGGDWLCLDTAGQVLFHSPGAANRLVCRSLSALFATFLDGLAHGEYRYEPFVGIERARPR
jgi:cell wall assembly regulator SMI1